MITKITEQNIGKYASFLAEAYQYLQVLERNKAYQFLSRLEWEKAYSYLSEKEGVLSNLITDTGKLSEINSSKSFTSHESFDDCCKSYEQKYASDYENFVNTVFIIQNADRDDNINGLDRTFKTNEAFERNEYVALYKTSDIGEVYIIDPEDRTNDCCFETLEQYFHYIEYIKNSNQGVHFLLSLPLDEGILDVDANTRQITIPKDFVSTVIQKDNLSETIIFTIDRFIDNIDLFNVKNVYVQWSAPNGMGGIDDKATQIDMIEVTDGKIKFGWPISSEVTEHAGTISFSIVFFSYKPNSKDISFRLNTLPATLEIKPALQPEINEESSVVVPGTAYLEAIKNNRYPGVGEKAPLDPTFNFPGQDLLNNDPIEEAEAKDGEAKELLKFEAQAVTSDNGKITYSWWMCPEGCEKIYQCDPVITEKIKENYYICKPGDVINEKDYARLEPESKNFFEEVQVYNFTGTEKTIVFEKEDGKDYIVFPGSKINKTSYDKLTEKSQSLFELNEKLKFYNFNGNQVEKIYYLPFGSTYTAFKKVSEEDLQAQDIYFVNFPEDSNRMKRLYTYLAEEKNLITDAFIDEVDLSEIQEKEEFTVKQFEKYYNRYLNQYPDDKETFIATVDEPLKVMYVKKGDTNNFIRYAGTAEQKTKQKYEKFTIFEVPEEGDIVGEYFVRAVSSKPGRNSETKKSAPQLSNPIDSTVCSVNGPVDLVFEKDLTNTTFIRSPYYFKGNTVLEEQDYNNWYDLLEYDEDKKIFKDGFILVSDLNDSSIIKYSNVNGGIETKIKEIEVETKLEGIDNVEDYGELDYSWFKADVDTEIKKDKFWENYTSKGIQLLEEDSNKITFNKPGWYRLHIDATKNRKTNMNDSNLSRVTYYPREYSLELDESLATKKNFYSDFVDGEYIFNGEITDVVELGVTPHLWIDDKGNAITHEDLLYTEKVNNLYSYIFDVLEKDIQKNEDGFFEANDIDSIVTNKTFSPAQFVRYYQKVLEDSSVDKTEFNEYIAKIDDKYVDQKNNKIYTDGIKYTWYRRVSDEKDVLLTATDPDLVNPVENFGVNNYYPSKIKVRIQADPNSPGSTKLVRYVCVATNFIEDQVSEVSEAAVFRVS